MRLFPALFAMLVPVPPVAAEPGAKPEPPVFAATVASLEWGIFCALQEMDRAPAPGTASGWIHVPKDEIGFHWPDRQVVPAALGLGFGVRITARPGWDSAAGEARVWRPGAQAPETWPSDIYSFGPTMAFFRFDTPDELQTGTWVFEGWDGDRRLYRAEFEVVSAEAVPGIAQACGATS